MSPWLIITSYTFFVHICDQFQGLAHSVHPPRPLSAGEVESPTKFSKWWGGGGEGGLDRTSTFREGLLGKIGYLFSGGRCNFHTTKKLKFEIFNYLLQVQACSDLKKSMLKRVKISLNLTVTYNIHIFFIWRHLFK